MSIFNNNGHKDWLWVIGLLLASTLVAIMILMLTRR